MAQDVDQCIESTAAGQELRDQGDLIGAEQQFVQCASNACPEVIRKDCQNWLSELGPSIPSIRLRLDGEFATEGRVLLDGRQVRASNTPIRVNPGAHEVKWEIDGRQTSTTSVTIGVGSLGKLVAVNAGAKLEQKVAEKPAFDISRIPPASLILGGVGAVGIGSFAVLGIVSRINYDSLSDCSPMCLPADTASAKDIAIAADVSLVLGIAALGAGTALYFVLDEDSPSAGRPLSVAVRATPAGAGIGLSGSF